MRIFPALLALAMATHPTLADAQDDEETLGGLIAPTSDPVQKRANREIRFAFTLLGTTYICREAVGYAHFQAAREIAIGRLTPYSSNSRALAVKHVKDLEKMIVKESTNIDPDLDPGKCMERINDIYYQYEDEPTAHRP